MKENMKSLTVVAALSLIAALVSGCSARQGDLVHAGKVSLEKIDAKGVHIMWAEVRQEGEYVVVTGSLTPRGAGIRHYSGHVDVDFIDSQGKLDKEVRSETIRLTQRNPGQGYKPKFRRFMIRAKTAVPEGGTVRVAFDLGSHD